MIPRSFWKNNVSGNALGINAPRFTMTYTTSFASVPDNPHLQFATYHADVKQKEEDDSPLGRKLHPKYLSEARRARLEYEWQRSPDRLVSIND